MSLIPNSDQGAPGADYFVAATGGVLREPVILPRSSSTITPGLSATLRLDNGLFGNANAMFVEHYVPAVSGGGLVPGQYQVFMYGPVVGGANIGYLYVGKGLGNGQATFGYNNGGPLDPARMGKIVGTGVPSVIPVTSIVAGSVVRLAFVGGAPALGDIAVTIIPNTSFSLNLPAGAVYNYEVVG